MSLFSNGLRTSIADFRTAVQALMSAGWTKGRNSGGLTERRPKDAFGCVRTYLDG